MVKPGKRWTAAQVFRELYEERIEGNEDALWKIADFAAGVFQDDAPSTSDLDYIFGVYIKSSKEFREGVDAAFRWWCGYNFDSLVAQALFGERWEDIVERWRKRRT